MLNLLILILELLITKKHENLESHALMELLHKMLKKGKKLFLYLSGCIISGIFIISGMITMILDMGMQWDRTGNAVYSGVMKSSVILMTIGIIILAWSSYIYFRNARYDEIRWPKETVYRENHVNEDIVARLIDDISILLSKYFSSKSKRK